MTPKAPRLLVAALAALVISALPVQAQQRTTEQDVTGLFVASVPGIDEMRVIDVGGILVMRGRTPDKARAAEAGRLARSMGYTRVANLIQISEPIDDAAIERHAERELAFHRSLDGCRFVLDSQNGVLHVAGQVQHELQKDVAVALLRNLDGVRSVRSDLRRF